MPAGAVVIWSVDAPQLTAFEILRGGLEIGRDLIGTDVQISTRHVRISDLGIGGQLMVEDLGSRNGTYVDGQLLNYDYGGDPGRVTPPTLVRIGRTVLLLVENVAPYLRRSLTTRYRLTVGASLHQVCDDLDQAILDEANVVFVGPRWVGRTLARGYLAARGGGTEFDAATPTQSLETALAAGSPRTVLLEAPNALLQPDLRTLRTWLETDVRFAICTRRPRDLEALPLELRRWLAPKTILIPEPRYDELPSVVAAAVANARTGTQVHASAIEEILLEARYRGEDELLKIVGNRLRDFVGAGETAFRGGDIFRPAPPAVGGDPTFVQFRMAPYPDDD